MRAFEQLDAWQACQALTVAVLETTGDLEKRDPKLVRQLQRSALYCSSRLARGAGTGSRRMLRTCAERSLGYVTEVGYLLNMADITGLMPTPLKRKLDALRGRAAFYTTKLIFEGIDIPLDDLDPGDVPEGDEELE